MQVSSAYRRFWPGHLAGDLVGEQPDVLGGADQVDDREVDLDEVGEVAELEELPQLLRVAGHDAGVPGRQLGDDARRRGADVVDVELGLRQAGDEATERLTRRSLAAERRRTPKRTAVRRPPPAPPARSPAASHRPASPSIRTVGVPLTPSFDAWSVAFSTHCSNTRSSIGPRTASSSAPACDGVLDQLVVGQPGRPLGRLVLVEQSVVGRATTSWPLVSSTTISALSAREE